MTRHSSAEIDVGDAFRRAALRLRSRSGASSSSEMRQLSTAVGNLLEALDRALQRDRTSIPGHVQRAALQVARQVRSHRQGHGSNARQSRNGRHARPRATGRRAVPFVPSIRLGRMG
jgi:hypothetical protein